MTPAASRHPGRDGIVSTDVLAGQIMGLSGPLSDNELRLLKELAAAGPRGRIKASRRGFAPGQIALCSRMASRRRHVFICPNPTAVGERLAPKNSDRRIAADIAKWPANDLTLVDRIAI